MKSPHDRFGDHSEKAPFREWINAKSAVENKRIIPDVFHVFRR
jgi:hypothetical protein